MPGDLWETGASLAENKDLGKRIRHSAFADPFRRKSASRIGKKLVSGAISFIPIPVVKSLVDAAVSKAAAAMQTTTSLVVDIAPTPLTKSPYTEGFYKSS